MELKLSFYSSCSGDCKEGGLMIGIRCGGRVCMKHKRRSSQRLGLRV